MHYGMFKLFVTVSFNGRFTYFYTLYYLFKNERVYIHFRYNGLWTTVILLNSFVLGSIDRSHDTSPASYLAHVISSRDSPGAFHNNRDQEFRCPFACVCDGSNYSVKCMSDFYAKVPPLPEKTRSAYLVGMSTLQDNAFSSCRGIRSVRLSKSIQFIEGHPFRGLWNLSSVSIVSTSLNRIPGGIFQDVMKLTELNLNSNQLLTIPDEPLCQTINLESIRVDFNHIKSMWFGRCFLLLRNLQNLILDSNKVSQIDSTDFKHLRNSPIKSLSISKCRLVSIAPGAFEYFDRLETLLISRNLLHSVPYQKLSPLKHLQNLDLSGIHLTVLDFQNVDFKNLSSLKISENKFVIVNGSTLSSIRKFPLTYLQMNKCRIRYLSSNALSGLPKLEVIDLRYNGFDQLSLNNSLLGLAESNLTLREIYIGLEIKTLDEATFSLSKFKNVTKLFIDGIINEIRYKTFSVFPFLNELTIDRCKLRYIAKGAFEGVKKLQVLHLANNALTVLPELPLRYLKTLDLSRNKITELVRKPFKFLKNLEVLSLKGNGLRANDITTSTFSGLTAINLLDLSNNQLTDKFQTKFSPFVGLKSLERLELYENSINRLHKTTFRDLINLKHLNMANNYLWFQEEQMALVFQNLVSLRVLSLESCGLSIIPSSLFANLTNLTTLYLGQNSISSWGPDAFRSLKKVYNLGLNNNKISVINQSSFEELASLRILDLSHNPFQCSCALLWFREWIDSTHVSLFFQYTYPFPKRHIYSCATPKGKSGMWLFDFKITENDCVDKTLLIVLKWIAGIFIPFILCVCAVIRYRWYFRYCCFLIRSRTKRYAAIQMDDYMFDAFVCYHADDIDWIIHSLLPNIEYEDGFKLCLHHRNWLPGIDIAENIVESIEMSRKTILVLTNKFAQSRWCQLETALAQHAYLNDNRDVIIMVLLEPIKSENMTARLHSLIQTKTYIEWTKHEIGQALFWKRVRRALMKPEMHGHVEMTRTGNA